MKYKSTYIYIVIFLIALLKSIYLSRFGFGLLDEGESLHNARRILMGEIPYRNFYSIFPPGDNYIFAFIQRYIGSSIIAPRLFLSVIFSFLPVMIYKIVKRFSTTLFALLISFAVICIDPNIERLYIFTPIYLSILLFVKGLDSKSNILFFLTGLCLGVISAVRFDIPGTYLIAMIGVLCTLWFQKRLNHKFLTYFALLSAGYSLPLLIVVRWMFRNGLIESFYMMAFKNSLVVTKMHSLPFPSLWAIVPSTLSIPSLLNSFTALFGWGMITIYIVLLVYSSYIFVKNKIFRVDVSILILAGVIAFPYVLGRSDLGHMVKGGMPFFILLPYVHTLISKKDSLLFAFLKKGIYAFVIVVLIFGIAQSIYWVRFNNKMVVINNYILRLPSHSTPQSTYPSADTLRKSIEFLDESDSDYVLTAPYMAGVYYLADKQSSTQFNNVLAGFITNESEEEMFVQSLIDKNVTHILYDPNDGPKMRISSIAEYNPVINGYIMSNYHIIDVAPEGWYFMIKNEN